VDTFDAETGNRVRRTETDKQRQAKTCDTLDAVARFSLVQLFNIWTTPGRTLDLSRSFGWDSVEYSQSHLGWRFWKLKAESTNISFATFQWKETFELWALSFETAFEHVIPSGIGCTCTYITKLNRQSDETLVLALCLWLEVIELWGCQENYL